ncbi:MAG: protein kinase domain-containing protein [Isosphaeraceae bacterium]
MTACPHAQELVRIGRGEEDGSCAAELADHIEQCPRCQEFLAGHIDRGLNSQVPISAAPGDRIPHIDGFTVERELGRGAAGVVYLAWQVKPRRTVALKLLPGGKFAGERERHRWLKEAEAAAKVRHSNVVTLYEVRESDDWFLLVMEYVPGGTLAARLTEPVPPQTAGRLMETIARAVHHIHVSGLLHLDLKPSNILLDGDMSGGWQSATPKVGDFGIACAADGSATETGGAIGPGGTPSYMAPEQINKPRKEMTVQADIHGLGAILYHLLTGRPPYQGATVLETIDLVQRQEPVPPRRLNPKIPSDLETICLKCLEKDSGRRYASAKSLAEDLSRWQDGRPIAARPVSAAEKSWRWCRRRPVIAALSAALVLTAVIGFTAVVSQWRRAEANFRAAIELASELVDRATGMENWYPKSITMDARIQMFERQRTRLLSLANSRPDDLVLAQLLTRVEVSLATELMRTHKHKEAQAILLESVGRSGELRRRHPAERRLLEDMGGQLHLLASTSERLGDPESSIAYNKRVLQLREDELRTAPRRELLSVVAQCRRDLAWALYSRGNLDEARSLIMDNQHALRSPPPGYAGRQLTVLRVLCRIDSLEFELAGALVAPDAGESAGADSLPLSRLASLRDDVQSPAEWGTLVVDGIRCRDADSRASVREHAEDALFVVERLTAIDSRLRHLHDIDRARRLAERMLAMADHLVKLYPREPASHLARSFAYAQIYKNAYESKDDSAVEPNTRAAYVAAQEALRLNPASDNARHTVEDLGRRLAALPKGR